MDIFDYKKMQALIGGAEPEPLNVTRNGTYAEEGKAYNPVVVNVPVPPVPPDDNVAIYEQADVVTAADFFKNSNMNIGVVPYFSNCVDISSGTTLSAEIYAEQDDWILATVTTRSATTYPDGWTLLHESSDLGSDASNQRMAFLCKQATADGIENLQITQANSNRIYINLIVFKSINGFEYINGTENLFTTAQQTYTVAKNIEGTVVWGLSCNTYNTEQGKYLKHNVSVPTYTFGVSSQPRNQNFIDSVSNGERVFSSAVQTSSLAILDCVKVVNN